MRELLRDLLESEGCRVYLAPGGREALSLFAVQRFDGVFTDVGMPGMSGWELAHAIRQTNETVPIAVITGWGEAVGSDEQNARGLGGNEPSGPNVRELSQDPPRTEAWLKQRSSQRCSLRARAHLSVSF